jgi:hypothetical protein
MVKRNREHDEHDAELGLEKFARIVFGVALQEGLTATDLESFMEMKTVPSSSQAHWDEVAAKFSLDASRMVHQLDFFSVPLCLSLPPSFHREAMRSLAQWVDVYQEMHSVRLIDVVCCTRFLSTTLCNASSFSGMCLFVLYSRVVLSIDRRTTCTIRRELLETRSSMKSTRLGRSLFS